MAEGQRNPRIVVVGNGVAGNTAVDSVRQTCPTAEVCLIAEEIGPEYSACVLADYVSGGLPRERVLLKGSRDYEGVNLKLGCRVSALDPGGRLLLTDGGQVPYDRLILALGGSSVIPPIPGVEGEGVLTLKTLEDADRLAVFPASEVVVIGSGPTGVEAAVAFRTRGMHVSLVESLPRILPNLMDEEASERVRSVLRENRIDVLTGERVVGIGLENGRVNEVETATGSIRCQLVVMTVGVRPNTALARAAGLAVGSLGGIAVDERMQTSSPGILACGDCAEVVADGSSKLQLFWPNARLTGRTAGLNAAGVDAHYWGFEPGMVLNTFDVPSASVGIVQSNAPDDGLETRRLHSQTAEIWLVTRAGELRGVQVVGRLEKIGLLATAVRRRLDADRVARICEVEPSLRPLARWLGQER